METGDATLTRTLRAHAGTIDGSVVTTEDPSYDEARRVWNGMVDRRPLALVQPSSVEDVVRTLALARDLGLPLAVRGGGHNVAGNGTVDDGVVLDLGAMNDVTVDAGAGTVTAGGGALLRDVDRASIPHGLAVPLGVVSATGVAGLTLGGGVGWLTRAHGLSADNLLDARVVTAAGAVVQAADDPELLWGLRGGGGNFGVATSLTFRAHELPAGVYAANFVYDQEHWAAALSAWEVWTRDLPDEMQSITTLFTPPPFLDAGDEPILLIAFAWAGAEDRPARELADALRAAAPPQLEESGSTDWLSWQSQVDEAFPVGARGYWKNTSFDRLDDEVVDVLVRRGSEQTWVGSGIDIHHMGGAFAHEPPGGSPFPARSARFWLNVYGFWSDAADDDHHTAFVRGLAADMAPFATGGQYVNFMARTDAGDPTTHARHVYGPAVFDRLVTLKRAYDPDNVFRLNHNIPPE